MLFTIKNDYRKKANFKSCASTCHPEILTAAKMTLLLIFHAVQKNAR
jgi:hypothetical protein